MKRLSIAMMCLAAAGLMTMVSCRKPNVINNAPAMPHTVTFNATTESGDGSKTTLVGLEVRWSKDDKISVNGNDNNHKMTLDGDGGSTFGIFTGTITATAPYLVGYPADATNDGTKITFTIPAEQNVNDENLTGKIPMAAYTTDENADLEFKNMVNVLKLNLTGTQTITNIEVTSATENLSGSFTVGKDLTPNYITSGTRNITVTKNMTLTSTPQTVYVVLPRFSSAESTVSVKFTGDAEVMTVGPKVLAGSDTPNHRYEADVDVRLVAPPYLSGDFSVSATTTVNFSKGNLQYLGNSDGTGTWRFAEHQWDYMGDGPTSGTGMQGNVTVTGYTKYNYSSSTAAGGGASDADDKGSARDLFGWGTSGYHQNSDNYNVNYMPYSTSTSTVNTTYNCYGYGPSINVTPEGPSGLTQIVGNISGSYYDWGVNNTIYAGGTPTTEWRTLTGYEWHYLLNTRKVTVSDGEKAPYGSGTVNGVHGLIILPDRWDGSVCSWFDYGGISWSNTFSESTTPKWSAMESAGAVFLPAAGYRRGTSVYSVGSDGCYWSSSWDDGCDIYHAHCLVFSQDDYFGFYTDSRYYGYPVRLVRDQTTKSWTDK